MNRTRPGRERWVYAVVLFVWVLNAFLSVAAFYLLFNWNAFVWIVGSQGWAIFFEILCVLCLVYLGCVGCLILGCEGNISRAVAETTNRTFLVLAYVLPVVILTLFLSLAVLALAHTPVSDKYVRAHSEEVFRRADTNHDGYVDFFEFQQYTLSLDQYQGFNSSEFRDRLIQVFDDLDVNNDGYLTPDDMFRGVLEALEPPRQRFGISVTVVGAVTVAFMALCWFWSNELKRRPRDPFLD